VYDSCKKKGTWNDVPNILVISDIWVNSFVETQGLVEKYVRTLSQQNNVIAVMEKQFVDFAFSSTSIRSRGTRYGQIYLGGKSGEVRSITYGSDLRTSLMSSHVLETRINYFRSVIRKFARIDYCGHNMCFECGIENLVMDYASSRAGFDVTSLFFRGEK